MENLLIVIGLLVIALVEVVWRLRVAGRRARLITDHVAWLILHGGRAEEEDLQKLWQVAGHTVALAEAQFYFSRRAMPSSLQCPPGCSDLRRARLLVGRFAAPPTKGADAGAGGAGGHDVG